MATVADQFADFATSSIRGDRLIDQPLLSTDTTLMVAGGDGAKFPANGPFMVLIGSPAGSHELVKCLSRSGDQLNIVRAQEGTGAAQWPVGTAVQEVVTAGNMTNIWNQFTQRSFNVKLYGALGDGTTDDSTAIQTAINDAQAAGGGVVFFPIGVYSIASPLDMSGDNIILRGVGYDSVIKPASGATFDAITTPIPSASGQVGYTRNYCGIEQLKIDCSQMTGTVAGKGNAIHMYGLRYGFIRDVFITGCPNYCILLEGDSPTNFGYNTEVKRCIFDNSAGGIYVTGSEAHDIVENLFKSASTALAAAQPTFSSPGTIPHHLVLTGGYAYVTGNVFGNSGTYTSEAVLITSGAPCRVIGNRFDTVHAEAIHTTAGGHIIEGNTFTSCESTVSGKSTISLGSGSNIVKGNTWDATNGAFGGAYCIQENNSYNPGSLIEGNVFLTGASGVVSLNAATYTTVLHNAGYHSSSYPFNVKEFGAVGNGTTDDTSAIQAAITACGAAGGGTVLFPAATYLISSSLNVAYDSVALIGAAAGQKAQLLAATTFSTSTPMVHYTYPGAGVFRYGATVENLYLNGNNVNGIVGLELESTYHAVVRDTWIRYCVGASSIGLWLNGNTGGFGAYTVIDHCEVTDGGAGIGIKTTDHEWSNVVGGIVAWYNQTGGVGIWSANSAMVYDGVAFDVCDTALKLYFSEGNRVIGCGFDRGGTQFIDAQGAQNCVISACDFETRASGATGTNMIYMENSGTYYTSVVGCVTATGQPWTNFVFEAGGIGPGNYYANNQVHTYGIRLLTGVARGNVGYNPVGPLATPAIPASGVAYTNAFGVDATAYVSGGTVSVIAVNGTSLGITSGPVRVPAYATIALTYTAAPSWVWMGE